MSDKHRRILGENFDVAVIGGGIAALSACIEASNEGSSVILINKGKVGVSGSSPKAAGILAASFGHGDLNNRLSGDTPEQHSSDTLSVGFGIGNQILIDHVTKNATDAVHWLEEKGVKFSTAEDGLYIQINAPGNSCPRGCSAIGGGHAIMTKLKKRAQKLGVMFIQNIPAKRIILKNEKVIGVEIQNDEAHHFIGSKSIILAAGGATGLFPSVSGDNNNTGSSLMLGYNAGAKIGNLEFIEFTLIYRVKGKILRIAGLAPFMSRGGKLLNKSGVNLSKKYFPDIPPEQITRADLLKAVHSETIKRNAPIFLDCTHFSKENWQGFEEAQGSIILHKIKKAGCDLTTEPIEVLPAAHSLLAGLVVDNHAATTVEGLFAAGENATGIHGAGRLSGNGLTSCVVMGRTAGKSASVFSNELKSNPAKHKSCEIRNHSKLTMSAERDVQAIVNRLREIVGNSLGISRNDQNLLSARSGVEEILAELANINENVVENWDAKQMAFLAKLMLDAALRRKENREVQFKTSSNSSDLNWRVTQTVQKSLNQKPLWKFNNP